MSLWNMIKWPEGHIKIIDEVGHVHEWEFVTWPDLMWRCVRCKMIKSAVTTFDDRDESPGR